MRKILFAGALLIVIVVAMLNRSGIRLALVQYQSSQTGLPLSAQVAYPLTGDHYPLLVVMHGFRGGVEASFSQHIQEHFANYGVFSVFPDLRGRGTSGGSPDASGNEIWDIADAIAYIDRTYQDKVDSSQVYLLGYAGGGGNALSAAAKFPDLFNGVISFFGISDYADWYRNGATSVQQSLLRDWVGGAPEDLPDRYISRNSVRAIANYRSGHLWLFHDQDDPSVPVSQSEAVAASLDAAGVPYALNISKQGDSQRWSHDFPDQVPDLIAAEPSFMTPITAKMYPEAVVSEAGSFVVAGYVDTKRFRLTLGAGNDEAGNLVYDTHTHVFTITTDTGAAAYTLVLKNQTPNDHISATVNGSLIIADSDQDGNVTYQGSL